MVWVAEHADDVLVDVLRFLPQFGMDPFDQMDGPTLFKVAPRLAAYGGVVTGLAQDNTRRAETPTAATAAAGQAEGPARIRVPAGATVVPLSAMQMNHSDWIERKVVGRGD